MSPADPASAPAVRVRGLQKRYVVDAGLLDLLVPGRTLQRRQVEALAGVSFDVPQGAAVAVIGANGAGKSSLLRALAGLSRPSSGTVQCHGTLGCLLDLGAGLVDEWTGEVNVTSALALQSRRPEDLRKVEEAADLGAFFREPVRTYSSGMRLRLAYALATATSPDILIADEVVAVGDEAFQRRCATGLLQFLAEGGTLILATHNMYLAERICSRALWLERGRVKLDGPVHEVTTAYRDSIREARYGATVTSRARTAPEDAPTSADVDDGPVALSIEGGEDRGELTMIESGQPWSIRISGCTRAPGVAIDLRRIDGTLVSRVRPRGDVVAFADCTLLPGRFVAELVADAGVRARAMLVVRGDRRELGNVALEHQWR